MPNDSAQFSLGGCDLMHSATISVARPELEAFRPRDSKRSSRLLRDDFFSPEDRRDSLKRLKVLAAKQKAATRKA
jgi:hypothetical protein